MASIITATTTSGLTQSADNSGVLQLASGTGNLVTVPSVTGTAMVSGNMPAFSAYQTSATALTGGAWTKITFNTELFDTNNNFTSSTFTPTVAGYYQVNGSIYCANSSGNMTFVRCNIYKNGAADVWGGFVLINVAGNTNSDSIATASGIVSMNGTTDYLELYGYIGGSSVGPAFAGSTSYTQFSACLIRTA